MRSVETLGFDPDQHKQPEQESSEEIEKEKKGLLQMMRESGAVRTIVIGMALEIASFSWHAAGKYSEYKDIKVKQEQAYKKLAQLEELEQTLESKRQRIKELFGNHAKFGLDEAWVHAHRMSDRVASERESYSFTSSKREIRGLEENEKHLEGMPALVGNFVVSGDKKVDRQVFNQILEASFPKSWIDGEVATISQSDQAGEIPEEYGLRDGSEAYATCYHYANSYDKANIVFHRPSLEESLTYNMAVMGHELGGHANDWENDNEMSIEERIDLLLTIGDRLEADDRFRSSYVEAIRNEDKQLEQYKKAKEYWAEICQEFVTYPDSLNIKDFKIVYERVWKTNPEFELKKAIQKKNELLNKVNGYKM